MTFEPNAAARATATWRCPPDSVSTAWLMFWMVMSPSSENVTLTAHTASASSRFDEARKRQVGFELSLVLSGMWQVSCVIPSVLQNTSLRRWQPVGVERGPNS